MTQLLNVRRELYLYARFIIIDLFSLVVDRAVSNALQMSNKLKLL